MKHKLLIAIFVMCLPYMMVNARKSRGIKCPYSGYSTAAVVGNLRATYDASLPAPFTHFRDSDYLVAESNVRKYWSRVSRRCDKNSVEIQLYEAIEDAAAEEYGEEDVLRHASLYLMTGLPAHAAEAYEMIARVYATFGKKEDLQFVLYTFERSSINKSGEYTEMIVRLREELDEVLHPKQLAAMAQGVWVSDTCTSRKKYGKFPYSILRINSLEDKGVDALSLPSFDNRKVTSLFRTSQLVEADLGDSLYPARISMLFSGEELQLGLNTSSGFEMTRRLNAQMQGDISTSRSTGAQIGASAATNLMTGMMNMALLAAAQSSYNGATMTLNLTPVNKDVMRGHLYHTHIKATTANDSKTNKTKPMMDDDVNFLRWLPEDSVYFVNREGKPYSVTPLEDLDLSEYKRIKRLYDLKCALAITGIEIAAAGIFTGGIFTFLKAPEYEVTNKYGKKETETDKGFITLGTTLVLLGVVAGTMLPCMFYLPENRNAKDFEKLNMQQLEKLRKKRQVATLQLSPTVNPVQQSAGISATLTY